MFGNLALVVAALFTGAAIYIVWAEQPARLGLNDQSLLAEWKPSYARGFTMQASLAVIGSVFGVLEYFVTGGWLWIAGAVALIANWPYTLVVMMPVNQALKDTPLHQAGPASRALIEKWGSMHAVRAALGATSTLLYLWASY